MVRFLVIEPAHQGSSLRLGTGVRIFINLLQELTGTILSVVGNVPVDSEAHVMTSLISRIYRFSLLELLIGLGLHLCIRRVECTCICECLCLYCALKKK